MSKIALIEDFNSGLRTGPWQERGGGIGVRDHMLWLSAGLRCDATLLQMQRCATVAWNGFRHAGSELPA